MIAVNTNYCARLNPWSLYNPVDPSNHLRWLIEELLLAEQAGENVHIIGHIPPDNRECTQGWLYNFMRIVERFQDTILAQYYGHTHADEFRVLYSVANETKSIGFEFVAPSLTTYTEYNPAYRVYQMNSRGQLFDHETYFFNITRSNWDFRSEPSWRLGYRALETFRLDSLHHSEWHQMIERMEASDDFFQIYYETYFRASDIKKGSDCKESCKREFMEDLKVLHPYKSVPKSIFSVG